MTESTVIQGLDEEYHNIDTSEVKSTTQGEPFDFHLVPTQDPPSTSSAGADPEEQLVSPAPALLDTGSLGLIDSTTSSGPSTSQLRPRGRAASYLEGKGFGWLLEVEDEEEDAKPLL